MPQAESQKIKSSLFFKHCDPRLANTMRFLGKIDGVSPLIKLNLCQDLTSIHIFWLIICTILLIATLKNRFDRNKPFGRYVNQENFGVQSLKSF